MVFRLRGRDTGGSKDHLHRQILGRWVRHRWGQHAVDHSNPKQLYNSFDASSILCYPCQVYHKSTDKYEKKHLKRLTHSHPVSKCPENNSHSARCLISRSKIILFHHHHDHDYKKTRSSNWWPFFRLVWGNIWRASRQYFGTLALSCLY